MISRFNTKWEAPPVKASPYKIDYEQSTKIMPLSFNADKSIKEYTEDTIYIEKKSKWLDYMKSFDIGSPSEQILNHLTKGTPLITAHTLPYGDYTPDSLVKGAEVLKIMRSKGITLDMLITASKEESIKEQSSKEEVSNQVVTKVEVSKGVDSSGKDS